MGHGGRGVDAEDQAGSGENLAWVGGVSLSPAPPLSENCCCYYSLKTLHNSGPAPSSLCHARPAESRPVPGLLRLGENRLLAPLAWRPAQTLPTLGWGRLGFRGWRGGGCSPAPAPGPSDAPAKARAACGGLGCADEWGRAVLGASLPELGPPLEPRPQQKEAGDLESASSVPSSVKWGQNTPACGDV